MSTHHDQPHDEWPEPDTSPNETKDGEPPATWNPGKVTQPPPSEEEDADGR